MELHDCEKTSGSESLCLPLWVCFSEFLSLTPSLRLQPGLCSFSALCLASPVFLTLPFSGSFLSAFVSSSPASVSFGWHTASVAFGPAECLCFYVIFTCCLIYLGGYAQVYESKSENWCKSFKPSSPLLFCLLVVSQTSTPIHFPVRKMGKHIWLHRDLILDLEQWRKRMCWDSVWFVPLRVEPEK